MAFWNRDKSSGAVRIYYSSGGRQKALSRKETKFLDSLTDDAVDQFVKKLSPRLDAMAEADPAGKGLAIGIDPKGMGLISLAESHVAHMERRGCSPVTARGRLHFLKNKVIPYFLSDPTPTPDPSRWARKSARLCDHLIQSGESASSIRACNSAIRAFINYLWEEGIIASDKAPEMPLREPPSVMKPLTPLKFTATAEDIEGLVNLDKLTNLNLSHDRALLHHLEANFFILLCFGFSIRPQEAIALKVSDLTIDTDEASASNDYKSMSPRLSEVLGEIPPLTIKISKQRSLEGRLTDPKAKSFGEVCLAYPTLMNPLFETYYLLQEERQLLGIEHDAFLISPERSPKTFFKNVTQVLAELDLKPKDLRRASLYWLGHFTSLPPIAIMSHARHSDFKSTQKYLRRPAEGIFDHQKFRKV